MSKTIAQWINDGRYPRSGGEGKWPLIATRGGTRYFIITTDSPDINHPILGMSEDGIQVLRWTVEGVCAAAGWRYNIPPPDGEKDE